MADTLDRLKTALQDRYAIERELGAGGMATVYLAEDLKLHRKVALKVLRPELASALGPDRFLQEIDIAAKLTHPHILGLHDCGEADGFLYYVMPYVEGQSLRDKLAKEGELPITEAVRILRDVVDALSHAHKHSVVHRDIKPDNVMLTERHALVTDFGVAKAVSEATGRHQLTTEGVALGTPAYMAPEQAAADPHIDHRADIYAVGAVAYELLTGRPPFTGTTQQEILASHVTKAVESVTEHRDSVPPALAELVMRCLKKKPADRWQTAEGLLPQLEALVTPSGGVTPTGTMPVRQFAKRRWMMVGGMVAVAAVAAVLLGVLVRGPTSTTTHPRTAVAVLPFENLSAEESRAYFASGLHTELVTQLAKVTAVKVIGRTSVLGYAGTTKPLTQIGDELGVGSIVEGSVQVEGSRLRVNVQLIDAARDEPIWAERYDRTLDDAFEIQSEVAQRVVTAVGAALTETEVNAIAAAPTENAEAYRLYLQGKDYTNRPGRLHRDLEAAQQLYERALMMDPNFALAHAALSYVHGSQYWYAYDLDTSRVEQMWEEAEVAQQLAPELPEVRLAIGMAHYRSRDFRKALEELTVAVDALPGSATLWNSIGLTHRRLGNWDEVFAASDRAIELDPRSADVLQDLGGETYLELHRYDEAIAASNRALVLAPDLAVAELIKARAYVLSQGQLDTLRVLLDNGPQTFGTYGSSALWSARLALWGRRPDALLALLGEPELVTFEARDAYEPGLLLAGWAHELSGDSIEADWTFRGALRQLDSALSELPKDWRVHAARGLVLAVLGRRREALREANWLKESIVYLDAHDGPRLTEARALIFAQSGFLDEALGEIELLLVGPSWTSTHMLRLDPRYDPIRDDPRFQALLERYGN